jgi:hypothetical protein
VANIAASGMTGISRLLQVSRSVYRVAVGSRRAAGWPASRTDGILLQASHSRVQALGDGWRRLGGATKAFHPDRPCVSLGPIRLTGGLCGELPGTFGVHLGRPDLAAVKNLA